MFVVEQGASWRNSQRESSVGTVLVNMLLETWGNNYGKAWSFLETCLQLSFEHFCVIETTIELFYLDSGGGAKA